MLQYKGQDPASPELVITGNLTSRYSSARKLNLPPAERAARVSVPWLQARDSPLTQWGATCSPWHSVAVPVCSKAHSRTGDRRGFGRHLVSAPVFWRNGHPLRTSSGQKKNVNGKWQEHWGATVWRTLVCHSFSLYLSHLFVFPAAAHGRTTIKIDKLWWLPLQKRPGNTKQFLMLFILCVWRGSWNQSALGPTAALTEDLAPSEAFWVSAEVATAKT